MTRRRALLSRVESGGGLPSAYQAVEYIGTETAGPYISLDTISNISTTDEFNIKLKFTDLAGSKIIFGMLIPTYYALNAKNEQRYMSCDLQWAGTLKGTYAPALSVDVLHTVEMRVIENQIRLYVDDNASGTAINTASATTNYKFGLFCRMNRGVAQYPAENVNVYEFKYLRDSVAICDLIPCYRKSDSEPGMYDLVTGTFFTNQGTGEFLYGANVN